MKAVTDPSLFLFVWESYLGNSFPSGARQVLAPLLVCFWSELFSCVCLMSGDALVFACRGHWLSIAREGAAHWLASLGPFVHPLACPCRYLMVLLVWGPCCPWTLVLSSAALPYMWR